MNKILKSTCVLGLVGAFASPALAEPTLQVYIDGATYNTTTETWVTMDTSFTLWVVGNWGNNATGILDVRLAAAFMADETGSITLTPTTATAPTEYTGSDPFDPSTAPAATFSFLGVGDDGDLPLMSDGGTLPSHGIYGAGVNFNQYNLGDMTVEDSPITDYGGDPLDYSAGHVGHVFAYDVSITGYESGVHFDAFNHIEAIRGGQQGSVFAPFSHDAESQIPAPGAMLLAAMGIGLVVPSASDSLSS